MMKNVVAGFVLIALIFMILLSYFQEYHECVDGHAVIHGHLIKGISCGSISSEE
jgi:hypothetical protein